MHRRAFDEELARRPVRHGAVARAVSPAFAVVGRVVGLEGDRDFAGGEVGQGCRITELGHALVRQQRVPVFFIDLAVAVDVGGRLVYRTVSSQPGIVDDHRDRDRFAAGQRQRRHAQADGEIGAEFLPVVEDRCVVQRRARCRPVDHVNIGVDVARGVGHMYVHRRPVGGERRDYLCLGIHQLEGKTLVGVAHGAGGIVPRRVVGDSQFVAARFDACRVEEQPDLSATQRYPGFLVGRVGTPGNFNAVLEPQQRGAAGGKTLQGRIVYLAAGGRHQAHVKVRNHEHRNGGNGIGRLGLPDVVRVLVGATGEEHLLPACRGVGPGLLEPDQADGPAGAGVPGHPVPGLAIHQYRCLCVI